MFSSVGRTSSAACWRVIGQDGACCSVDIGKSWLQQGVRRVWSHQQQGEEDLDQERKKRALNFEISSHHSGSGAEKERCKGRTGRRGPAGWYM